MYSGIAPSLLIAVLDICLDDCFEAVIVLALHRSNTHCSNAYLLCKTFENLNLIPRPFYTILQIPLFALVVVKGHFPLVVHIVDVLLRDALVFAIGLEDKVWHHVLPITLRRVYCEVYPGVLYCGWWNALMWQWDNCTSRLAFLMPLPYNISRKIHTPPLLYLVSGIYTRG